MRFLLLFIESIIDNTISQLFPNVNIHYNVICIPGPNVAIHCPGEVAAITFRKAEAWMTERRSFRLLPWIKRIAQSVAEYVY